MAMETESTITDAPKQTRWATASCMLCIAGCLVFVLGIIAADRVDFMTPFRGALLCWRLSFVFGVIALVKIRIRRSLFAGKTEAMFGICLSGTAIVLIGAIMLLLKDKPFDESHPASVIATIQTGCGFKFPERMESLKAAGKVVGNSYVFIATFMTHQKGLDQLRNSLNLRFYRNTATGQPTDPTERYLPRHLSGVRLPQWYKGEVPRGRTWKGLFAHQNNSLTLITVCVELPKSEKVAVYLEGWCDPSLRKDKN